MPGVRRWELVIALALVVSSRSLAEAFDGAVTTTAACVRFVLAGLVCWAAVAILERLWDTYSRLTRERQLTEFLERRAEVARGLHGATDETPNAPEVAPGLETPTGG